MPARPSRPVSPACVLVLIALVAPFLGARCADPGLAVVRIAQGLDHPVFVASPPGDGRLFVVERGGFIRIWKAGELLAEPFLDLTGEVPPPPTGGGSPEQGLIGLAFAPDYASSGIFYVSYFRFDLSVVVARFRVSPDPDRAEPVALAPVVQVFPPGRDRIGGHIEFGPDGMLWVGLGDGGGPEGGRDVAQAPNGFLGKLLRLDVDVDPRQRYAIPVDNPFVGTGIRPEIWALGLRHPERFHVDPWSGLLFLADAGASLEELNVERLEAGGGANYGWGRMEGSVCLDPSGCEGGSFVLEPPVFDRDHTSADCPFWVDGLTYYGSAWPLFGQHLYADLCTGEIHGVRVRVGRNGRVSVAERRDWTGELVPDAGSIDSVASFGRGTSPDTFFVVDPDGEIFQIGPGAASSEEPSGDGGGGTPL